MENIIEILIKIAGVAAALIITHLCSKASKYLKTRISAEDQAMLECFVSSLVAAAEQTLKEDDENGSRRLEYVQTVLMEAGYELTEAVCALIESKVYDLNVKAKELKSND